jgi:small subunit ribosomal protein S15
MSEKKEKSVKKPATPKATSKKKVEVVEPVIAAEPVVEAPVAKPAKKAAPKASGKTAKVIKKYQSHDNDTGSTDVQVAVLTEKITALTKHLQGHKKDHDSRMGLLKMIGQRRSLLNYLEKKSNERYKKLIAQLGLRK